MPGRNQLSLDQLLDSCFQSWVCVQNIMSFKERKLTKSDANRLLVRSKVFLRSWSLCASHAQRARKARFNIKPKHHAREETFRAAAVTRVNPACFRGFGHGGFVGVCFAKMVHKCQLSSTSTRELQRWLIAWQHTFLR